MPGYAASADAQWRTVAGCLVAEVRRVGASELRAVFNKAGFYERVLDGELAELVIWRGTPSPHSRQPNGTESQQVAYFDRGVEIARVHQFVLKDGSLGASGRPDPKAVLIDDVLYVLDPDQR